MDTDFIDDSILRKRVENSLQYILVTYDAARNLKNIEHRAEAYRVIILYCVSIIEALLFDIYHRSRKNISKFEYKSIIELPSEYINKKYRGKTILAVREEVAKRELEISFIELLTFLKGDVMKDDTVDRIKKINQKRNTFHLRKKGSSICKTEDVEEALSLLELCIKNVPRFLKE